MAEKIGIHGLDQVRIALRRLPKEIRKRELNKALRAGAKPIVETAKTLVPIGESFTRNIRGKEWNHNAGLLRDNIVYRNEKKKYLNDAAKIRIGVLVDPRIVETPWYWRFIEFGTQHMSARPFLVPAFEMMKYVANELIKKKLLAGVERQAKRVKR